MHPWSLLYALAAFIIAVLIRDLTRGGRKMNEPKMFYYATLISVVFWLMFNFLAVNSSSYNEAIMFYIMMFAAISTMVAFVYLNAKSFTSKIVPYDVGVALLPLFFLLLFSYAMRVKETMYGWAIEYTFFQRAWIVVISLLMIYTVYLLIKTRAQIASEDSRWRMKVYMASIVLAFLAAVPLSVISEHTNLPSIGSLGAALFIPIGYFAFRQPKKKKKK